MLKHNTLLKCTDRSCARMLRSFVREGAVRRIRYKKPDPIKSWSIVRGDQVVVLSGPDKGKKGKVTAVDRENNRLVVDGLNLVRASSFLCYLCCHSWFSFVVGMWQPQRRTRARVPLVALLVP